MSHKFVLPSLPASMNALYNIIYSQRRVELKPEVRLWKNLAKAYIPPWLEDKDKPLWISLSFFGNWITKGGKIRKIDHCNMEKVTIDLIAEKLGFDDSLIYEKRMSRKVQSDKEQIEVELGVI